MKKNKSVCVYCGSRPGNNPDFTNQANKLGQLIGKNGLRLVYGAGAIGLMGEVAKAARDNGSEVLGIIPNFLMEKEANSRPDLMCDEVIKTETMLARKELLMEKSDAFLVMPGGIGTLEEIVEVLSLAQLDRIQKPVGFLNVDGFWDPFFQLMKHMDEMGFIHGLELMNYEVADNAEALMVKMMARLA